MKILVVNDSSAEIIEALIMDKADFNVEVDKALDGEGLSSAKVLKAS